MEIPTGRRMCRMCGAPARARAHVKWKLIDQSQGNNNSDNSKFPFIHIGSDPFSISAPTNRRAIIELFVTVRSGWLRFMNSELFNGLPNAPYQSKGAKIVIDHVLTIEKEKSTWKSRKRLSNDWTVEFEIWSGWCVCLSICVMTTVAMTSTQM